MTDKNVLTLDINDRAKEYSVKLQGIIELGDKGAMKADADRAVEIFKEGLPEGLDMKTVKEVQDASIDFAAGQADALATASLAAMQKDEELDATSLSLRIAGNRYDSTYTKKREGNAMGKPWVKYGTVTQSLVQGSGRRGGLNAVVKYHSEMAKSIFEK